MAPENFKESDEPYDPASDVYAYGILLYEMISGGRSPYEGRSLA